MFMFYSDLPSPGWKGEGRFGGICVLPPAQAEQQETCEEVKAAPPAETPSGPILPGGSQQLAHMEAACIRFLPGW